MSGWLLRVAGASLAGEVENMWTLEESTKCQK